MKGEFVLRSPDSRSGAFIIPLRSLLIIYHALKAWLPTLGLQNLVFSVGIEKLLSKWSLQELPIVFLGSLACRECPRENLWGQESEI